ncbi:hypothetical protein BKA93DRAFT_748615 [Sparassis latifolia]|uniref:Uncharacterized protein n=1 Tax=Sparassis crispa TaxID=139825 RepID=A0A401GZJ4_9APHY|nr:predicted protein [Sparassis crispa]GBE87581.1 predicted protein [Sparassis crispa]
MSFRLLKHGLSDQARRLILSIIQEQKGPISVQDIFRVAVQKESESLGTPIIERPAATTDVPYPEHEVKSMRYLKKVVLPILAEAHEIEKVHSTYTLTPEEIEQRLSTMTKSSRRGQAPPSTIDLWRWQVKAVKPTVPKPKTKEIYGTEVGVGEDFSHLNKRRQRSRVLGIARDVRWLKKLEVAKEEGLGTLASSS